jgi:acyl carrier protein
METSRRERESWRAELRSLIAESAPDLDGDLADDTPLISSGLVESTTLLSVALWVEQRVGAEIDLAAFDLATEWDSLAGIMDFVEQHGPRAR